MLERGFKVIFKKTNAQDRKEKAYGELYKTKTYCCSDHYSLFPVFGQHAKAAEMTRSRNNCVGASELPLDLSHRWAVPVLFVLLILQKAVPSPFKISFP